MSFHLSMGMPMIHCLQFIYLFQWTSPIQCVFKYLCDQAHDTMCTHLSVDMPIVLTGHLGMGLVLGLEVEVLVAHIVWLSGHQALVLKHLHGPVVDQVVFQGVPSPTHPYHQVTIFQELQVSNIRFINFTLSYLLIINIRRRIRKHIHNWSTIKVSNRSKKNVK